MPPAGPNVQSLGSWLKSCATRWFGGAKPILVGAKSSTVPICKSVLQSTQGSLVARWNFADRLNQYAERNRLVDVYTRPYRRFVLPFPRPGVRGLGTLLGFAMLAPTLRNVDSKESGFEDYLDDSVYPTDLVCRMAFAKYGDAPVRTGDVRKFEELYLLRCATAEDGKGSQMRNSSGAFIGTRNRVLEATSQITEITDEVETQADSFEKVDSEVSLSEVLEADFPAPVAVENVQQLVNSCSSDSDGFSVVDEEFLAPLSLTERPHVGDQLVTRPSRQSESFCNEKSLSDELKDGQSSIFGCDYSVITEEESQDQSPLFHLEQAATLPGNLPALSMGRADVPQLLDTEVDYDVLQSVDERSFEEVQSITETVFECGRFHQSSTCDRELETRSKVKVKMRASLQEIAEVRVGDWLVDLQPSPTDESDTKDTQSCTVSEDDALLRTLHDTAEYLVHVFACRDAIPHELVGGHAPLHASAWRLVAPRVSVLQVPVCSMLGDQLLAVQSSRLGAVRFDSATHVPKRTRLNHATSIVRTLCTLSSLGRAQASQSQKTGQLCVLVRQKPRPIRAFLRQLELELLDWRVFSASASRSQRTPTCVRALDSVLLQTLEFAWSALVNNQLTFASLDFERLVDALGVELDACCTPHLVLLGDGDCFAQLFTVSRSVRAKRRFENAPSASESFASFVFVVYQNFRRVVQALEVATGPLLSNEAVARWQLYDAMLLAREDNVDCVLGAMRRLRSFAPCNPLAT